ncbi:MAG: sporulation integral membrane protein YtvI [Clostridia bacterium]|nr:sporulation integral membrane protein YtvI [Clostridia bacterium]
MNEERIQKRKGFIINTIFFALILVLAYIALEYVLVWVMPFLLGFLVALVFRPLIRFLCDRLKLNRRACAFVVLLLGYGLLGFLVWRLGFSLFGSIKEFCMNLPSIFADEIAPFFNAAGEGVLDFAQWIAPNMAGEVEALLNGSLEGLQTTLGSLSTDMLSGIAGVSAKLPLWTISFVFTILSSLFISMDYDTVIHFVRKQVSGKTRKLLKDIKKSLKATLTKYVTAYVILMMITFLEVSVGLWVLRVNNPFGIGAVIAITDVFPVLGTGTVVIPWAVISLFQGRYYLALGLAVLYLIVTVVRHFIEPKVIGDQLGIHPIVALVSIYLGFVWFGVVGAIAFPVIMNILLSLQNAGHIHIWK